MNEHLAVALRREHVARRLQFAPQLAEVVDFAVEDDGNCAVGGEQRLGAAGDIDHGKATMAEADGAVVMKPVGIGPAMRERRGHRRQRGARPRIVAEISGDAAHGKGRSAVPGSCSGKGTALAGRCRAAPVEGAANYSLCPAPSEA